MAMYPCCRVGRVLKYLARDKPPLGFDNIVPQPSDVAANHQVSDEFGKQKTKKTLLLATRINFVYYKFIVAFSILKINMLTPTTFCGQKESVSGWKMSWSPAVKSII